MIGRIANLFRVPEIRTRLWITLVFLVIYRVGYNVPIPGVNMELFKAALRSGTRAATSPP